MISCGQLVLSCEVDTTQVWPTRQSQRMTTFTVLYKGYITWHMFSIYWFMISGSHKSGIELVSIRAFCDFQVGVIRTGRLEEGRGNRTLAPLPVTLLSIAGLGKLSSITMKTCLVLCPLTSCIISSALRWGRWVCRTQCRCPSIPSTASGGEGKILILT